MTISTERVRQYATDEFMFAADDVRAMAAELLAVREAQSVPAPIAFSENADADMCRMWAWEQVKKDVTTDSWTIGDSGNFYGFYCWGWDMRRQYNEQRPPAVPDFGALTKLIVGRLIDCGTANDDSIADAEVFVYNACRAAMLQSCDTVRDLSTPVDPQIAEYEQSVLRLSGNSEHVSQGYTFDGLNIRAVAALRESVRNQWLKSEEFADKIYWKNMHSIANEIIEAMAAAPTPTKAGE